MRWPPTISWRTEAQRFGLRVFINHSGLDLIECGLFECGLRQGILTPQDRYWLEFLAFQVALVRGDLKEISRKLNASFRTIDLSRLEATVAKLDDVASLLKLFIGEV
jgi:hypothetical protein